MSLFCICITGFNGLEDQRSTSATSSAGAPPAPTQSGIVAHCLEWYMAQTNDSCTAIASAYSITLAQFNTWKPAVGDEAYCVKAPTTAITTHSTAVTTSTRATMTPPAPTQAGIPSECNAYDVAQDGDGCEVFASRNKITVDQLSYCIGVSS
ncbi:hypothetical protein N7471_013613 [Penicillium samsonianum]|uniref:uncharacterized protein n=1 Tax=Penicillium samsonianum TaxID=1882272 RepID=UPI00254871EB|nr:uncharacterized protein N7471_013613 [Penicillium samsonianum]KAJ6118993.1 hypothetical protein N7471_013613 [Penicillium samsonianum]